MTSSSSSAIISSSQQPKWNYDVFLSFRGDDTRKTFTSHLYERLDRMGIVTFQDDKRLEHGTSISEKLCKAIEESQFAIIIFSKNYASSGWCLDELVKIMQCGIRYGQTVIPVFYDVDPSTIRYQKESYAEAFAKHESRYSDDVEGMQKVKGWRSALTAAANLTGHDIRNRIEAECIQQIVDEISSKLCNSTPLSFLQDIVGINTHLERVKSLLKIEINDVRIVGIWGMVGVGKTTIARALFSALSYQFEAACFLADVKENKHGMHSLQNTILSELLRKKSDYVNHEEGGKDLMARRLCSKKVLVVLDDIDHIDHLEYLAGDLGWFGKGSRIIVTTRNKHLIANDVAVHEVTTLPDHEAIQLFNQHAFKKEVPDERFEKLSWEVVNHAKGLPLALKVWGSFLYKRDITKWRSTIKQMKNNSNSEIVEKLKISYDGLELIEQEMFLDIACFFRGREKDEILQILESCNFEATIGLSVLIEKSLVFIYEDRIEMHDLIQDMGKYVVNMQKDLGERSRLWLEDDVEEVMINNTGTKAVEAIWICSNKLLRISKMALNNMNKLRVLCLRHLWYLCISCQDGSIEYLSNNLRWLAWDYYAWESLPDNFEPKKLVHLELHYSSLHHLWTEPKNLWYLRSLDLRQSDRLIQGPDFTGMPNLEVLHLPGCSILEAIHPSLGNCRKLIQLDLSGCASLRMFPCFNVESLEYLDLSFCESLEEVDHSLGCCKKLICLDLKCCFSLERFPCVNVESLEYLGLYGCSSLEKFPEILGSMKSELRIDIQRSGIRELPLSAVDQLTHIISELNLSGLKNLVALPDNICKLKSLKVLTVSGCSKLESLPEEIGELESLEKLEAQDTLIYQLPSSITQLNKLKKLDFSKQKLEEAQATVQFVFPRMNKGLRSLEELHLNFCNLIDGGLPEDIGCLSSLHWLYLKGNNFDHLPQSISQLGALTLLNVSHCKRLKQLPELPQNVKSLWADCHVSQSIQKYKNLNYVEFTPLSVEFDDSISDLFAQTLLQCILSFQKALSVSDSLSQGVFKMWHPGTEIPDWFKYHCGPAGKVLLVNLPENWYANGNFLGFAICYCAYSRDTFLELIVLSNEDKSVKLRKNIHIQSPTRETYGVNFFFLPLSSLWDTSKGNEKTPNAYGHLKFSLTSTNMSDFGFRLVYKDEPELEALLRRSESDGKSPELYNGIKRTRYDNSERHDLVTDEASCSSSKKQRAHSNICESFVLKNLQLQEGPMPSNLASLS